MKFDHSILGGTFDHFHLGHQRLIAEALRNSRKLTIGITTEKMLGNKRYRQSIEPYEVRENSVREFIEWSLRPTICPADSGGCRVEAPSIPTKIIPLTDIYGNALIEKYLDAIFVTNDTYPGAKKINKARRTRGFTELEIVIVPFVNDENGKKITSERIRAGETDREGKIYLSLLKGDLRMPDYLRGELAKPWGKVLKNPGGILRLPPGLTIAVGDIVSRRLTQAGYPADLSIVDGRTNRRKIGNAETYDLRFKNEAGTINAEAVKILDSVFRANDFPRTLFIEGEEDLLALPAILLAPIGSRVYYGLRDQGAVIVKVDEEVKERVRKVLLRFVGITGH